jgi:hypothetical protein
LEPQPKPEPEPEQEPDNESVCEWKEKKGKWQGLENWPVCLAVGIHKHRVLLAVSV